MQIFKKLFLFGVLVLSAQVAFAQVSVGGYAVSAQATATVDTAPVACTMDAKLCPDGVTYVGRTGPSCAFAACPSGCVDLKTDLRLNSTDTSTNGDVSKLQSFLFPTYLKVEPTGRFLGLTRAASVEFQKQYGISPAFGNVGPLTRAKIKELTCGGTSQTFAIQSITPSTAKVGQTVVLSGPGLNSGNDYVLFDGFRIQTDGSKALNRIGFVVPEYITNTINCIKAPCPLGMAKLVVPGTYTIQVVNDLGTTNTVYLTVTDGTIVPPSDAIKISKVEPQAAKVGASVIIYGYNMFRPETRILFDGMSISGMPVYSKQAGNFNSALEFVVPEYISPQCNRVKPTDPCPLGMVRQVVPGTYELAVDNKYGRDAVKFEVLGGSFASKPAIKTLNPSSGAVKTRVAIWGENINSGSEKIYFGGSFVNSVSNLTTDRRGVIYFDVPEYITPCGYEDNVACRMMAQQVTPGKYEVVVKNNNGVSNVLTFTVTAAGTTIAPKINSLTPSAGLVGTEVVIKGEGINIGSDKIYFGGSLIPPAFLTSASSDVVNTLRFKIPTQITPCGYDDTVLCRMIAQQVVPGTYDVVVKNNNGVSNILVFTVTSGSTQTPSISSLSPQSGVIGTRVTVYGSNIDTGTEYVLFNGYRIPTDGAKVGGRVGFIVPEQLAHPCIQAKPTDPCPAVMVRFVTPGNYTVAVANVNGTSNVLTFTVTETSQLPTISSVNPSTVAIGTQVSLSGERLNTGSAKIVFGNGYITPDPTRSSDSTLVFTVPSMMSRYCAPGLACTDDMISVTPGTYDIKVVNSFGTSNIKPVSVVSSVAPTISSLSPSAGGTGIVVTISGANLSNSTDFVWFGGVKLIPNRSIISNTALTFVVPNTLFQCDVKPGEECLAVYQPTPLGYYLVKVESGDGKMSNSINYQVTSNNSSTY